RLAYGASRPRDGGGEGLEGGLLGVGALLLGTYECLHGGEEGVYHGALAGLGGVVLADASEERLEERQQTVEGDAALPAELRSGLLKAVGVVVGGFSAALLSHRLGGDGELLPGVGCAGRLRCLCSYLESLGHALTVGASAG